MSSKVVLHVGCGPKEIDNLNAYFRQEGYRELRLDINSEVMPDIVGSILDMQAVVSRSVDAVFSSHNIEHLFAHEVPRALGEFVRVLRPDGFAMISTPDLQAVAERIVQGALEEPVYHSDVGPIAPLDILYGHGVAIRAGNHFMAHKTGFTASTLRDKLLAAGFSRADVVRKGFTLFACAYMPDSPLDFQLQ